MRDIRLIALDLDGTLLDSEKRLSETNRAALERAASEGIHIVPTTGRFYNAMPDVIRSLPFVRYAILINGACVLDTETDKVLYRAEMKWDHALKIMEHLDTLDVIYDCFMDNRAWMTRALKEKIDEFAPNEHYRKMLHELREPVDELKAFVREKKHSVQKIQFFFRDPSLREELIRDLSERFPDEAFTSAVSNNIEINHKNANKGNAVRRLSRKLGFGPAQVMSFGDGLNDLPMIICAGLGVAMDNASDYVKSRADYVTDTCDNDGVAQAISHFLWENRTDG
jgi:Cof subfamily protein (haloacid dehalogenase superfamily)